MRVCTTAQREDVVWPPSTDSEFLARRNNMAMQ